MKKKYSFQATSNYFNCLIPNQVIFPQGHRNSDFYPKSFNNTQFAFYQLPLNKMNYVPQVTNINMNLFVNNEVIKLKKETKKSKEKETLNFESLEELQEYLSKGKQLGNYIKCRKNTDTMINLTKKLPSEKIGELIELIKTKLKDIMISNNKFSQKLFEQCNAEQRLKVLTIIKDQFADISMNKWGSFSLQALIKNISLPEEHELIKTCIQGKLSELSMNKRSNFILQKLLLILNEKTIESLCEEMLHLFDYLICNTLGVGLLKSFVFTIRNTEIRAILLKKITENLNALLNTPPGIALILQILEKFDAVTNEAIITQILSNIDLYIRNTFSLPIIKKCISLSNNKLLKCIEESFFESQSMMFLVSSEDGRSLLSLLYTKIPKKVQYDSLVYLEKRAKEIKANFGDEQLSQVIYKFIEDCTK